MGILLRNHKETSFLLLPPLLWNRVLSEIKLASILWAFKEATKTWLLWKVFDSLYICSLQ